VTRRRIAMWLAALVALSGVLPVGLLAIAGLQIVQRRGVAASQEALQAVAEQAAARIEAYVSQQREMLRTLAMAVGSEPDAQRRLSDASLDAPSLGKLRLIGSDTPAEQLPKRLTPGQITLALAGNEVASQTYVVELAPAMEVCVPCGLSQHAVCATLDLLELQRQVQRIHLGAEGYALAFDRTGRVLAAGEGSLRAAVLTGEPVPESAFAAALVNNALAPQRLRNGEGRDSLAGWAMMKELGWSVAVEQPVEEALHGAQQALWILGVGGVIALFISITFGYAQARKLLLGLELEERFRTAGQLASGITHDLGHRLTILRQIEQLAAMGDPDYLPRIRDSLATEVGTLRRFVSDFSDLTREAKPSEFLPLELNAFAKSVAQNAQSYADEAGVKLEVLGTLQEQWVKGDRYLLERAALNLTRNAIEASKKGARVELRVERADAIATLRVKDEGPGIAHDRLSTLFESFTSTKRTGAHVGMGLPNVKRIVSAHGGTVAVTSEQGRGSVFTLALPAQSSPSAS
jgi:signal transduction histidine kinase